MTTQAAMNMSRRPATRRHARAPDRRGAAAVEFALILPLFITIVLGCIDFGRFAYTYIAVTNAARVGAGYASSHPVTTATMSAWQLRTRDAILDEFGATLNPADITITGPTIIFESGGIKRVQVQVQGQFRMVVNWPGLPNTMNIARTVEMRVVR